MNSSTPLQSIRLHREQSHWMRVEASTTFVGMSGRFVVTEAPRSLGEVAWRARTEVQAGQAHVVESAGWVQLAAQGDAELRCLPEAARSPRARLARGWRTLAGLASA